MKDLEKYKELFLASCNKALELQKNDGEMSSGHNGSYHDPETPVRNTAHWLISFSKAYELTKEKKFYDAIVLCKSLLKAKKWRPYNKTYYCREKETKDKCNGLIGQAWAIEGLIMGYRITGDEELLQIAIEIFKLHPFQDQICVWEKVDVSGEILGIDHTFNHQLWFAMAGFLILNCVNDSVIEKQCMEFIKQIPKSLILSNNGRIGQSIKISFINDVLKKHIKKILKNEQTKYMKLKEIGYHAFNTYAFSEIYFLRPELDFFKSKMYKNIIEYLFSSEYIKGIIESKYGFKYNPPGFEVLYTCLVNKLKFSNKKELPHRLMDYQISNHYSKSQNSFSKNVHDSNTSSARIYELSKCFNSVFEEC